MAHDAASRLRLLSVAETAQSLGCSVANVYSLIETGLLPFVSIGVRKGYRIDSRDLDAFVVERKTQKSPIKAAIRRPALKHIRLPPRS